MAGAGLQQRQFSTSRGKCICAEECHTCSVLPRALWCSKPMAVIIASFRFSEENIFVASLAPPSPASTMAISTCTASECLLPIDCQHACL